MPKYKIWFADFWDGFEDEYLYKLIIKKCPVEISRQPDYVFYSVFGSSFLNYPNAVRIFFTGENVIPDFNTCDYAIGFHHLSFEDRYLRFPLYYHYHDEMLLAQTKHVYQNPTPLLQRGFCSYVVRNAYPISRRDEVFHALCRYKTVYSGGKYLNNIGKPIGQKVEDKLAFQHAYKFSICVENSHTSGYVTEKLLHGFAAQTVPIYWGSPTVDKDFNKEAFIDIADFPSIDAAVRYIQEVDENDDLYLQYLRAPAFLPCHTTPMDKEQELLHFLGQVFHQPLAKANRREDLFYTRIYYAGLQREKVLRSKYSRLDRLLHVVDRLDANDRIQRLSFKNDTIYKAFAKLLMK